jgi:hypothetical protein
MDCGCSGGASWTPPPLQGAPAEGAEVGPNAPGYYASPDGKTVTQTNSDGATRPVPVTAYPPQ